MSSIENIHWNFILQKIIDRYVEDETEKGPNWEQRKWEEEHLQAALQTFGARDAKKKEVSILESFA